MSTLLGIFSYPAANERMARHYPYFLNQKADWIYGIGTTDGLCRWPEGVREIDVGDNRYIEGPHLPNRLLDTIEALLLLPWDNLILTESDTLFFKPIDITNLWTVAAHRAGSATWGSKAQSFYHNPWAFKRYIAHVFLAAGRKAIKDGICPDRGRGIPSTPECSPDVFFGYVCESINLPVQELWTEYSRNDLSIPEHLHEAKLAFLAGVQVIHGIKTEVELEVILL